MKQNTSIVSLFPELVGTNSNTANKRKLGYVGRKPGTERNSDAWFTPTLYLDSVRAVLGDITLDPFSCKEANGRVKAKKIFTEQKSAFDHGWNVASKTTVFMNPPYSAGLVHRAINRFVEQYTAGAFQQGIVLVNNATDTRWFKVMASHATALCFTDHRISFWNSDNKKVSGNTRGQVFAYFGPNVALFKDVFSVHGLVVVPA